MKLKLRIFAGVLSAAMALGSLSFTAFATETAKNVTFDENNIILRYGAFSDIHVAGQSQEAKYAKALDTIVNLAGGKENIDAVTISGDALDKGSEDDVEALKDISNRYLDSNRTEIVPAVGNHEAYNSGTFNSESNLFVTGMGGFTFKNPVDGNTPEQIIQGNYHTVIKGVHFITVKGYDYDHSTENLDWMKLQLDAARADYAAKGVNYPIIVLTHVHPVNTCYGSSCYNMKANDARWHSHTIGPYLENYPEVVIFSGHSHTPIQDDTILNQIDFTSVGTGSVTGGYCHYVEMDKNGTTRITRLYLNNSGELGIPIKNGKQFIFPAAKSKDDFVYTPELRYAQTEAPYFKPERSNLEVTANTSMNGASIRFRFDSAYDDDMVQYYSIQLWENGNESGYVAATTISTPFTSYVDPTTQMPEQTFSGTLNAVNLKSNTKYTLRVYAVDSFNKTSTPLTYEITSATYSPNPIQDFSFKPVIDFEYFPLSHTSLGTTDDDAYIAYNANFPQRAWVSTCYTPATLEKNGSLSGKGLSILNMAANSSQKITIKTAHPDNPYASQEVKGIKYFSFYLDATKYTYRNNLLFSLSFNEKVNGETSTHTLGSQQQITLTTGNSINTIFTNDSGRVSIPDNFRGYVMIPVSSFTEKGAVMTGNNVQDITFTLTTGSKGSEIIIDDIGFLVEKGQSGAATPKLLPGEDGWQPQEPVVTMGDINNDKEITIKDALLALQHSVRLTELTGDKAFVADVNENGEITIADALQILQYSVGLITEFVPAS